MTFLDNAVLEGVLLAIALLVTKFSDNLFIKFLFGIPAGIYIFRTFAELYQGFMDLVSF